MKNYLKRFYPYQLIRLSLQSLYAPSKRSIQPTVNWQHHTFVTPDASSIDSLLQTIQDTDSLGFEDRGAQLQKKLGFMVHKKLSTIPNAGTGVYLNGRCGPGQVVCLYPGTVYLPQEPLLLVSLANQYILKCFDGIYVDGKRTGLSGYIYRSVFYRENWPGATQISDLTWMSDVPRNPLAIGQMVNNGTNEYPANVCYQEIDIPKDFTRSLRKWIPNSYYGPTDPFTSTTRIVALVATRQIENEELFSTYMDTFHN
ncbi:hypothetical protein [Absidia glauca]|uniref:SET domain-containing protein n=1 Tax=Absidia glauca TaxID=4829 RepID=A0A163JB85_ABSGL|nr:hypothetical protein [Absidia glauca]